MARVVGAGLLAICAVLVLVASAGAAPGHRYSGQFSGPGSGGGQLSSPAGVAVNATSGDVYVIDVGNNRVQRFDAVGDPVSAFDLSAADGGGTVSGAIAVDEVSGDVYVSAMRGDTFASVVDRFSASGVYEGQIDGSGTPATSFGSVGGLAVDPSNGTVYVSDGGNSVVDVFDDAGGYLSQFGVNGGDLDNPSEEGETSFPGAVAVDSTHAVYVIDGFGSRVQKFTAQGGSFVSVVAAVNPSALAVDPSNDHLLVGGYDSAFTAYEVSDYTPAGQRVASFGAGRIQGSSGHAVNGSSKVYVADSSSSASSVLTFAPFTAPTVTTDPASGVTAADATLNATVNPEGVSTTYRFEYGTDTTYGSSTAESDPPETGTGDVPASVAISGLAPNTTHHYRVVATNPDGSNAGQDQTFTTALAAPDVETAAATSVTFEKATLHGSVDPNNSQATYHFEYGTDTSYGSSTPDGDAGAGNDPIPVDAVLTGLQPATTYHYRLVADNGTGGPIAGPDRTFTTADQPPVVVTAGVTGVTTGTATLHGTVDTHGLAGTYRFSVAQVDGTYSDATASVEVPAGSGPVEVSATIVGLPAGGRFTARLGVTTSAGSRYGAPRAFDTLADAPYVPAAPPTDPGAVYGGGVGPRARPPVNSFTLRLRASGSSRALEVVVPGPGRIAVSGRRLRAATAIATAKGAKTLRLKLTRAGKRALRRTRGGRLGVRLAIRFTPTGGTAKTVTRAITFTRSVGRR